MKYQLYILMIFLCLFTGKGIAQPKTDSLLEGILARSGSPMLKHVTDQKDSFRVQFIYTQINRDETNNPVFTHYSFNLDDGLYFNPASTVKLPLALLSLEKLNQLNRKGLDKYTTMQIDSSRSWHKPYLTDSSAQYNKPAIAHFIRRAMLISENDPYNRLYQFVGQQQINQRLHSLGYNQTRITRQFLGLSQEQNRITNPIRFIDKHGKLIYSQPEAINTDSFHFGPSVKIGNAYYNQNDSLIHEPIDFTYVNKMSLKDFHTMLQTLMFPASFPTEKQFQISEDDYHFMYKYLSQFPSETSFPKYDTLTYYDSYVKFFFRDSSRKIPPNVRVFNKVGWAYGFLIDASYVVDFDHKVEYILSASIYVNRDGVLNDNKYDYDTVGWPFMYQLGQVIYQYELQRPRKQIPNLDRFKIKYEKRDPKDSRPPIRNADN
jgi:Beta-lactamase enzyme family